MLWSRLLAAIAVLLSLPLGLVAHDFTVTEVAVIFSGDGGYQIDMSVDADALALGLPPDTDSAVVVAEMEKLTPGEFEAAVERAKAFVTQYVRIRFDGARQSPAVEFPQYGTAAAKDAQIPTVLGTLARMQGRIPAGAQALTFGASEVFKAVKLTVFDPSAPQPATFTLGPGEESPPHVIGGGQQTQTTGSVLWRYTLLGFEHILPLGLDHILFVLGLFLLSAHWRPLLWQVTAFTVAHSVTLALAMFDVVSLPSRLVETLIAASIAYVAIENLFTSKLHAWRPAVVFCFGLLHGLGFAGVLQELGLPREQFVPALISFNVGVELGQLTVVSLAFLAVGWLRERPDYRKLVVIPCSAAIAAMGIYWAITRWFF